MPDKDVALRVSDRFNLKTSWHFKDGAQWPVATLSTVNSRFGTKGIAQPVPARFDRSKMLLLQASYGGMMN